MDDAQQLQVIEDRPRSESASILAVIERATVNPHVDIEKMERLFALHEKAVARSAKEAYFAAFAAMQSEIPEIAERGQIKVGNEVRSTYALWEDVNDAIKPILQKHGFGLSFRVRRETDRVVVTGILAHSAGHTEETECDLPLDTSGAKNNVQAFGSSVSYGKRYAAGALLNITTRGEDDDGAEAGGPEKITEAQAKRLRELIEETGSDLIKFCQWAKIDALPSLPQERFDTAIKMLQSKPKKGAANA